MDTMTYKQFRGIKHERKKRTGRIQIVADEISKLKIGFAARVKANDKKEAHYFSTMANRIGQINGWEEMISTKKFYEGGQWYVAYFRGEFPTEE